MKLDNNSKSILIVAVVAAILCLIVLVATAPAAKAGERPMSMEEKIVSELIEADRRCDRGEPLLCTRVAEFCPVLTQQRVRDLRYFIRNDYPYKAKNGAMNITTRFNLALRKCVSIRVDTSAMRG